MPYVTSWERIFRKEGHQEGLLEGLKLVLEVKFGEKGLEFCSDLEKIVEIEMLTKLKEGLRSNLSLDELRQLCQSK